MAAPGDDDERPWGRFKLVSKDPANESDHLYFCRNVHRIGRSAVRADIVLDLQFISQIHCVITRREVDGEQVVTLQDLSRNGVYVNETRVGKSNSIVLEPNITVHMTKPGLRTSDISPTVYKFELLATEPPAAASTQAAVSTEQVLAPEIAPTQDLAPSSSNVGAKRSSQDAELDATQPLSNASAAAAAEAARQRLEATTAAASLDVARAAQDALPPRTTAASNGNDSSDSSKDSKRRRTVANANDNADADALAAAARLQQRNREQRESLQQCQRSKAQLRAQLLESQSAELQLRTQLHDKERELQALTTRCDAREAESQRFSAELAVVREQLAAQTAANAQLATANRKLEHALAESQQAHEEAKRTVADVRALNDALNASLNDAMRREREREAAAAQRRTTISERLLATSAAQVHERSLTVRASDTESALSRADATSNFAEAKEVFQQISAQVAHGQRLVNALEQRDQQLRAIARGSAMRLPSQKTKRIADDSSVLDGARQTPISIQNHLSEHSEPLAEYSSDMSTYSPGRKPRALQSPLSSYSQTSSGSTRPSSSQSSSGASQTLHADDGDGSEEQVLLVSVGSGTPNDSEDSVLSGHSSSKTPPAPPIRVASTPNVQIAPVADAVAAAVEAAVEAVEKAAADDVDASDEAVDADAGAAADSEQLPLLQAADAANDDDDDDASKPVAVTSANATDADAADGNASASRDAPADADAAESAPAETVAAAEDTAEPQLEADAATDAADKSEQRSNSDGQGDGAASASAVSNKIDDDDDDQHMADADAEAHEDAVAPATTTTAAKTTLNANAADAKAAARVSSTERLLPPIATEESLESEPSGGLFDDETQLSQ